MKKLGDALKATLKVKDPVGLILTSVVHTVHRIRSDTNYRFNRCMEVPRHVSEPYFKEMYECLLIANECISSWLEDPRGEFLDPLVKSDIPCPGDVYSRARAMMDKVLGSERGRASKALQTKPRRLRIPQEYWAAKLEDIQEGQCVGVEKLCSPNGHLLDPDEGAYLYGPNGRGKTHMACALALKWECVYWDASQLHKTSYRDRKGVDRIVTGSSGLLLDDISLEARDDRFLSFIGNSLKLRLERNLPTIVTGMYSPQEWSDTLRDTNIASRLSRLVLLKMTGENRHVRKALV